MDIKRFTSHLKTSRRDLSPETIRAYESDLTLFQGFLDARGLRESQMTSKVVTDYIEQMENAPNSRFGKVGLSEATIARRIAAIRKYLKFRRANSNSRMKDPTRNLTFRAPDNDTCKAVGDDVIKKLVDGIKHLRDRALVLLFLSSGLRNSELQQLSRDTITVCDRDEGNGGVGGVGTVIGKGSKKRAFFCDAEALDALCDYLATRKDNSEALFISERGQRMSKRAIQERVAYWCKHVGIEHLHPHQFRHCFATRLANVSIDSMVLKELMGHEDLRTTNRYFKLEETTKARQYFAAMERRRERS